MKEKVGELFSSIGFSKAEQTIYLDLLQHPDSTATEIAKRTKVHRPNVYGSLSKLEGKGYVLPTVHLRTTTFRAESPEVLLNHVQELERNVHAVLPQLKALQTPL